MSVTETYHEVHYHEQQVDDEDDLSAEGWVFFSKSLDDDMAEASYNYCQQLHPATVVRRVECTVKRETVHQTWN